MLLLWFLRPRRQKGKRSCDRVAYNSMSCIVSALVCAGTEKFWMIEFVRNHWLFFRSTFARSESHVSFLMSLLFVTRARRVSTSSHIRGLIRRPRLLKRCSESLLAKVSSCRANIFCFVDFLKTFGGHFSDGQLSLPSGSLSCGMILCCHYLTNKRVWF